MVQVASKPSKAENEKLDRIWVTYKRTLDPNLRNVLIERYYPLVRYISERLLATLPKSIDLEDLVSAVVAVVEPISRHIVAEKSGKTARQQTENAVLISRRWLWSVLRLVCRPS